MREVLEKIQAQAAVMQAFMEAKPTDDPTILVERLAQANAYLALSGKLLADAKHLQNDQMTRLWNAKGDAFAKLGTTLAQKLLVAYCKDESYLVDWLDRINRGLVHSSDNLRTLISFAKENMRMSRYAGEVTNDEFQYENESEW